MNINVSGSGFGGFATLAVVVGLVQIVLWLVIAWRAMRAHENIAASLDSLTRHIRMREEQAAPGERGGNGGQR